MKTITVTYDKKAVALAAINLLRQGLVSNHINIKKDAMSKADDLISDKAFNWQGKEMDSLFEEYDGCFERLLDQIQATL